MLKVMFFIVFILFASVNIQAANNVSVSCAPQLQNCINKMQKLPEIRELLAEIQREGLIRIITSNHGLARQFGAFWDPDQRTISVNLSAHTSEGELIGSILFEMHNASINSQLDHLDYLAVRRQIDKRSYVEAVERLEYQNSVKASKIAQKGIELGIFPPSATLQTYSSFEEHYRIQQEAGHSSWIARTYDNLVN